MGLNSAQGRGKGLWNRQSRASGLLVGPPVLGLAGLRTGLVLLGRLGVSPLQKLGLGPCSVGPGPEVGSADVGSSGLGRRRDGVVMVDGGSRIIGGEDEEQGNFVDVVVSNLEETHRSSCRVVRRQWVADLGEATADPTVERRGRRHEVARRLFSSRRLSRPGRR